MSKRLFILLAMVATFAWAAHNATANALHGNTNSNHFSGLTCGPDGTPADNDDIIFEIDWKWTSSTDAHDFHRDTSAGGARGYFRDNCIWVRSPNGDSFSSQGGGSYMGGHAGIELELGGDTPNGGENELNFYWQRASTYSHNVNVSRIGQTASFPFPFDQDVWHHVVISYLNTTALGGDAKATIDGIVIGAGSIVYSDVAGATVLHGSGFKGFGITERTVDGLSGFDSLANGIDGNRRWDNIRVNGGVNGVDDNLDSDPTGVITPGSPSWITGMGTGHDYNTWSIEGGVNLPNIYGGSAYANVPTTTNAANLLSSGTAMASLDEIVSMDFQYPTTCTGAIATANAVTASLLARADGINGFYGAGDGATTHGKAIQLRVSVVDAGGGNYRFHYDVIQLDTNNAAGTVLGGVDGGAFDHAWHRLRAVFAGGGVGVREGERDVIVVNGLSPSVNGLHVGIASSYSGLAEPTAAVLIDNVTAGGTNLDTGFQFESGGVVADADGVFADGPTTGPNAVYASNVASWALSPDSSDVTFAVTAVHGWEMY